MKKIEYRLVSNGIAVSYWKGEGAGSILFCPGLPQYVSFYHPFIDVFLDLGFSVFAPKYAGTWESEGLFTIAGSAVAVNETLDLIKKGKTIEQFNQDEVIFTNGKIFLLGFSYGAIPALLSRRKVDKLVLLSPFTVEGKIGIDEMEKTLTFLDRAYKNVYRFDQNTVMNELQNISFPQRKEKILVVWGVTDSVIPPGQAKKLAERYQAEYLELPVGHTANLSEEQYKAILSL